MTDVTDQGFTKWEVLAGEPRRSRFTRWEELAGEPLVEEEKFGRFPALTASDLAKKVADNPELLVTGFEAAYSMLDIAKMESLDRMADAGDEGAGRKLDQMIREANRSKTFGYRFWETVLGSFTFGQDIAISGGATGAAKLGVKAARRKIVGQLAQEVMERRAKKGLLRKAAEATGKGLEAAAVSEAIKAPLGASRVQADAMREALDAFELSDEDAEAVGRVFDVTVGDFRDHLVKAGVGVGIEFVSERFGPVLGIKALQARVAKRWMKDTGKDATAFARALEEQGGWSGGMGVGGMLEEYGEEIVGGLMRMGAGLGTLDEVLPGTAETAAIFVMGGTASAVETGIKVLQPGEASETARVVPEEGRVPKTEQEALEEQRAQGAAQGVSEPVPVEGQGEGVEDPDYDRNVDALRRFDAGVDAALGGVPRGKTVGADVRRLIYRETGIPEPVDREDESDYAFRMGSLKMHGRYGVDLADKGVRKRVAEAIFRAEMETTGKDPEAVLSPISGYTRAGQKKLMADAFERADEVLSSVERALESMFPPSQKGAPSEEAQEEAPAPEAEGGVLDAGEVEAAGAIPADVRAQEVAVEGAEALPEREPGEEGAGAAPQAREVETPDEEVVSVMQAVVEDQRAERGADPVEKMEATTVEAEYQKAMSEYRSDKAIPLKLVDALDEEMRSLDPHEPFLVDIALIESRRGVEDAVRAWNDNPTDTNRQKVRDAERAFDKAERVAHQTGSMWGKSGRMRQEFLKRDYSLANMLRRGRLERGRDLTDAERAEIQDSHDKMQTLLAEKEAALEEGRAREAELTRLLEVAQKEAKTEQEVRAIALEERSARRRTQRERAQKRIDELAKEIDRAFSTTAGAAGVPRLPKLLAQFAVEHVKLGYVTFEDFADRAVSLLGERVRPLLAEAWSSAQESPRLKAFKTRRRNQIKRLQEADAKGEFIEPAKREPLALDAEALALDSQYELERKRYENRLSRWRRESQTAAERLAGVPREMVHGMRSIRASYDVSFWRQAKIALLGSPSMAPKAFRVAFKALRSEEFATKVSLWIQQHPLYKKFLESGAHFTKNEGDMKRREDEFRSRIGEELWGVKHSGRAHVTALNWIRFTKFLDLYESFPDPDANLELMGTIVNLGTGRADISSDAVRTVVDGLNWVWWSAHLNVANIQWIHGMPLFRGLLRGKGTARGRLRLANELYVKPMRSLAIAYAAIHTASWLASGDDESWLEHKAVELDWDRWPFMRVKIMGRWYDPTGGIGSWFRFFRRQIGGVWSKDYREEHDVDLVREWSGKFRQKLSPSWALGVDVFARRGGKTRTNAIGQKISDEDIWWYLAVNVLPLSFDEVIRSFQEEGVPGLAPAVFALLGVNSGGEGELEEYWTPPWEGEQPVSGWRP